LGVTLSQPTEIYVPRGAPEDWEEEMMKLKPGQFEVIFFFLPRYDLVELP
jgi:hypothetical protein